MLDEMKKAYEDAAGGVDEPDCLIFPSYEEYVKTARSLGMIPLTKEEMS